MAGGGVPFIAGSAFASAPMEDGGSSAIVTVLQLANQNMSRLIETVADIFPRVTGTFTLAAAATTVVTEPAVTVNSIVLWTPTNAAAATLISGAKSLYLSARVAGASFTVATADGNNAGGTETFSYVIVNPS